MQVKGVTRNAAALLAFGVLACHRANDSSQIRTAASGQHPAVSQPVVHSGRATVTVQGSLLQAFLAAYAAHVRLPGLSASQSQMANYVVQFEDDKRSITVTFIPVVRRGDFAKGGETSAARSAQYVIDTATSQVVKVTQFE